jgi:signal transduction histidine kinase
MGKLITVTEEDIARATMNSSRHCAVAEAVARSIPSATVVAVDIQTIRYSLKHLHKRAIYLTPRSVIDYIVRFDAGDKIDPFVFKLSDRSKQVVEMKTMNEKSKKRLKAITANRRVMIKGGKPPPQSVSRPSIRGLPAPSE